MSHLRPAVTLAVAAAYTMFGALGLSDMVICVSPDRHVAIESVHEGCCQELVHAAPAASARDRAIGTGRAPTSAHCGDCIDIPLAIANHDQESPQTTRVMPPTFTSAAVIAPGPRTITPGGLFGKWSGQARATPPHLASLRGVLMRC